MRTCDTIEEFLIQSTFENVTQCFPPFFLGDDYLIYFVNTVSCNQEVQLSVSHLQQNSDLHEQQPHSKNSYVTKSDLVCCSCGHFENVSTLLAVQFASGDIIVDNKYSLHNPYCAQNEEFFVYQLH